MAFIHCNFFSERINNSTAMCVILPQRKVKAEDKIPTLYLLHGYTDDYTVWQRKTAIERYVSGRNICVVMPDVQKSFYSDFHGIETGYRYWQFISGELLDVSRQFFPLSHKREDTFVAGLSMGGFGAFKLALNCPEKFAAAASLSGSLDMARLSEDESRSVTEFAMLAGHKGTIPKSQNDLFHAAAVLQGSALRPRLFQSCGTEDFLFQDNVRFKEHLEALGGFDLTYRQGPGDHNWDYWDKEIQFALDWLGLAQTDAYGK